MNARQLLINRLQFLAVLVFAFFGAWHLSNWWLCSRWLSILYSGFNIAAAVHLWVRLRARAENTVDFNKRAK